MSREDELRPFTVGELQPLSGPIELADYDPRWPELFRHEMERIRAILGERELQIEHVGSTAVPALAAKPIIDIRLVVADSATSRPTSLRWKRPGTCCASASRTGTTTGF